MVHVHVPACVPVSAHNIAVSALYFFCVSQVITKVCVCVPTCVHVSAHNIAVSGWS